MILQIVVVRDTAVNAFGQPSFVVSTGGAIRSFSDEVNRVDPANTMNKHSSDFELYHLGTYDDQDAQMSLTPPRLLTRGADVKSK